MKIWTIQSLAAWEHLTTNGVLQAKAHHQSDQWLDAYSWMRDELAKYHAPTSMSQVPLWGWYQWRSSENRRPDLRSLRHHWGPAGDHAMIECEVPEDQVLISDYDAWHVPLNDWYVSENEQDEENFKAELAAHGWSTGEPIPDRLKERQRQSWKNVFVSNPNHPAHNTSSLQTCFWEISLEQVVSSRMFTSRCPEF